MKPNTDGQKNDSNVSNGGSPIASDLERNNQFTESTKFPEVVGSENQDIEPIRACKLTEDEKTFLMDSALLETCIDAVFNARISDYKFRTSNKNIKDAKKLYGILIKLQRKGYSKAKIHHHHNSEAVKVENQKQYGTAFLMARKILRIAYYKKLFYLKLENLNKDKCGSNYNLTTEEENFLMDKNLLTTCLQIWLKPELRNYTFKKLEQNGENVAELLKILQKLQNGNWKSRSKIKDNSTEIMVENKNQIGTAFHIARKILHIAYNKKIFILDLNNKDSTNCNSKSNDNLKNKEQKNRNLTEQNKKVPKQKNIFLDEENVGQTPNVNNVQLNEIDVVNEIDIDGFVFIESNSANSDKKSEKPQELNTVINDQKIIDSSISLAIEKKNNKHKNNEKQKNKRKNDEQTNNHADEEYKKLKQQNTALKKLLDENKIQIDEQKKQIAELKSQLDESQKNNKTRTVDCNFNRNMASFWNNSAQFSNQNALNQNSNVSSSKNLPVAEQPFFEFF